MREHVYNSTYNKRGDVNVDCLYTCINCSVYGPKKYEDQ